MTEPNEQQPEGIWRLSHGERQVLALALLARPRRSEDGLSAFRQEYPLTPAEMLQTATHHVYVDGPDAVIDFLADAELATREPRHEIGYGTAAHLLDHVYNWLQFRALLPEGKQDLLDLIAQMELAVRNDDRELILATAQELRDVIDGNRSAPDVTAL